MQNLILIDAWNKNFIFIALLKNNELMNLFCESPDIDDNVGNIYSGKVVNVVESISAYFVDYGCGKNGFLPFMHAASELKKDNSVIVQIAKNEKGGKGARLTGFVKIIGRHSTFLPYGSIAKKETHFISRQHHNYNEIQEDFNNLHTIWGDIQKNAKSARLLYKEHTSITRIIRDKYLHEKIHILIDGPLMFDELKDKIAKFKPDATIEKYNEMIPLFHKYKVWNLIKNLTKNNITLPDGGSIVIDSTEAMVCIDVNSASSSHGTLEATSYKVNIKAAEEAGRQLRLRDLSGIIAIDFIDMYNDMHIALVEAIFKDSLKYDSPLIKVLPINMFGVLMLSRPRSNLNINSYLMTKCEKCNTHNIKESKEFIAMQIINDIRINLYYKHYAVNIECADEIAAYILNDLRYVLYFLEQDNINIKINIKNDCLNSYIITPKCEVLEIDLQAKIANIIEQIKKVDVKKDFIAIMPYRFNNNTLYDQFGAMIINMR